MATSTRHNVAGLRNVLFRHCLGDAFFSISRAHKTRHCFTIPTQHLARLAKGVPHNPTKNFNCHLSPSFNLFQNISIDRVPSVSPLTSNSLHAFGGIAKGTEATFARCNIVVHILPPCVTKVIQANDAGYGRSKRCVMGCRYTSGSWKKTMWHYGRMKCARFRTLFAYFCREVAM
jgi:hypothetical protein